MALPIDPFDLLRLPLKVLPLVYGMVLQRQNPTRKEWLLWDPQAKIAALIYILSMLIKYFIQFWKIISPYTPLTSPLFHIIQEARRGRCQRRKTITACSMLCRSAETLRLPLACCICGWEFGQSFTINQNMTIRAWAQSFKLDMPSSDVLDCHLYTQLLPNLPKHKIMCTIGYALWGLMWTRERSISKSLRAAPLRICGILGLVRGRWFLGNA